MADQSWREDELRALNSAIAQGAMRVKYVDKEVDYRTLKEMLQLRGVMEIALGKKKPGSNRKYITYKSGLI